MPLLLVEPLAVEVDVSMLPLVGLTSPLIGSELLLVGSSTFRVGSTVFLLGPTFPLTTSTSPLVAAIAGRYSTKKKVAVVRGTPGARERAVGIDGNKGLDAK